MGWSTHPLCWTGGGLARAKKCAGNIWTKKLFLRFALLSRPAASSAALGPVARYDA